MLRSDWIESGAEWRRGRTSFGRGVGMADKDFDRRTQGAIAETARRSGNPVCAWRGHEGRGAEAQGRDALLAFTEGLLERSSAPGSYQSPDVPQSGCSVSCRRFE